MILRRPPYRPEPICGSETMFPVPVQIVDVQEENFNTKTFTMRIDDRTVRDQYRWIRPIQHDLCPRGGRSGHLDQLQPRRGQGHRHPSASSGR